MVLLAVSRDHIIGKLLIFNGSCVLVDNRVGVGFFDRGLSKSLPDALAQGANACRDLSNDAMLERFMPGKTILMNMAWRASALHHHA
jgi:hypothetical protein